jgi:hypothetical protein
MFMKPLNSRREFLRGAVRYSLLGAAIVMARLFYVRRSVDTGACQIVSPCRQCAVFQNCNLPKAGAARRAS